VHSQLRENQQIDCQRFDEHKSREGDHPGLSGRVASSLVCHSSAALENLGTEQRGRGDRCHEKLRQQRNTDSESDHWTRLMCRRNPRCEDYRAMHAFQRLPIADASLRPAPIVDPTRIWTLARLASTMRPRA
jgi:hypothetical protein